MQDRAFALARWRLREALFGLREPPPQVAPSRRYRAMLAYAYATWAYRFVLFLGIALLVYHFFWKGLGIVLMIVELGWFIGRPIFNEALEWRQRRARILATRQTRRTTFAALALVLIAVLPWQSRVPAPALLRAERQTRIYTAHPGRVPEILVRQGQSVAAGEQLLRLASPDLEHSIAT